ncbi:RagB/SusD family nutrient uptake outer membrane protein [Bacteroides sp. CR5/BHMF/2]|nr:RagB/SusD family nutrient uptake outer membrane protein [Bacteroides sp. CR5/BHMF/2]
MELCWAAVHTANELIVHLEPFEMDATKKQDILTQARFIRALTYFNLVRFYGGCPSKETCQRGGSYDNTATDS